MKKVGNCPNGSVIQQYIKGGRKSKQNLNYHLFNNMLRGRKYQEHLSFKGWLEIRKVGKKGRKSS